ncbi:MAG: 2-hydroxyacyl-CoA dehydratase [Roseburia sp.]|nr:2-hydroxyacyl-CoA dehydratase [Roseburia sp.]
MEGETFVDIRDFKSQQDYFDYCKNVQHPYSHAVGRLIDLASSYIFYAEEQATKGQKASYCGATWEAPLFYGCNVLPVANTELGRLGSRQAISVAENHFLIPREACSMLGSLLGEWYLRKDYPIKMCVGASSHCEAQNMVSELIKNEGYKIYRYEGIYRPPHCTEERRAQLVKNLTRQLEGIADFLCDGKPWDEEAIRREIHRNNEAIDKVKRIMDLRIERPTYVKSLATMYLMTGLGHYFGRPDEYIDILDELIDELENCDASFIGRDLAMPIVWIGGRGQEFGVYHAVDQCNGALLGWVGDNCCTRKYDESLPVLESLAAYYIDGTWSGASEHKMKYINEQLELTKAKGVIFYGYVGCSYSGVEHEILRADLKERGISSLSIQGTFQVGPPSGQLLTRVSAFVEMLS